MVLPLNTFEPGFYEVKVPIRKLSLSLNKFAMFYIYSSFSSDFAIDLFSSGFSFCEGFELN